MINNFYTLLSRDKQDDQGRITDLGGVFKQPQNTQELHTVLVPNTDTLFSALCTEQLLQVVLESDYRDSLLELDPNNTYAYPILSLSDDYYSVIGNTYNTEIVVLNENLSDSAWGKKSFSVVIDPTAMEVQVASLGLPTKTYELSMTNNLSNKIRLANDVYMRIKGTLPTIDYTISIQYTQKFNRDINNILTELETINIPWKLAEYTEVYMTAKDPFKKLSAVTMNLYEILKDGQN
jgi:hypothetical protein